MANPGRTPFGSFPNATAEVFLAGMNRFTTPWYQFFNRLNKQAPQTGDVVLQAIGPVADGRVAANGAAISRANYAGLFAVLGTAYGAGDGVNTFNVPNWAGLGGPSLWTIVI